jgi:hypothetical protein
MGQQGEMFTPTAEEAQEHMRRYWESYLGQALGFAASVEGKPLPEGMVKALAVILAANALPMSEDAVDVMVVLFWEVWEAAAEHERRSPSGRPGAGCGGR